MEERHKKNFKDRISEKEYRRVILDISIAVIISVCLIIAFYFAIKRWSSFVDVMDKFKAIISPFIYGAAMAFLMNPIMKFMEKRVNTLRLPKTKDEKRMRKRTRAWTSIVALLILVGIIVLFLWSVIPTIVEAVMDFYKNLDSRVDAVLDWADQITLHKFTKDIDGARNSDYREAIMDGLQWLVNYLGYGGNDAELIGQITSGALSAVKLVVNIIIGAIVSVYILCSKEVFKGHFKKIIYGIFRVDQANVIMDITRKTNEIFYGFIVGKIIDSAIIGAICYISCLILKMPYPVLVSVIIGVTNIIPVFGPYIGAVPTVIIIFLTDPWKGIYFLIFVIILQQIDGNIIGPKILGDSTGLSSFWVVVAIVVGGGLFGVFGMLLGVPTMAVIYYICGRVARRHARKRGLPEQTTEYVNLNHVDVETHEMIMNEPEHEDDKMMRIFGKKNNSPEKSDTTNK